MKTRLISAAAICAALAIVPSSLAQTLEEVEKKLADLTAKVKSMSYKYKFDTNMEMSGFKMKQQSEMVCEYMWKGDTWLSRVETKGRTEQDVAGEQKKSEYTSLAISDGEFNWTLSETDGQKQVMKMKQPQAAQNPVDTRGMFKQWREQYDLKLLPDEKTDGRDCWVLEMTPKPAAAASNPTIGKMVQHYDKATGMAIKTISKDNAGKETSSMVITDLKVGADFSPDRFKFKAPEGVPVMDYTKTAEGDKKSEEGDKPAKP